MNSNIDVNVLCPRCSRGFETEKDYRLHDIQQHDGLARVRFEHQRCIDCRFACELVEYELLAATLSSLQLDSTHCPSCGGSHRMNTGATYPTWEKPVFREHCECMECGTRWHLVYALSAIERLGEAS